MPPSLVSTELCLILRGLALFAGPLGKLALTLAKMFFFLSPWNTRFLMLEKLKRGFLH